MAYEEFLGMYQSKLTTAEEAVKVIKSGDWVDYGFCNTHPHVLDEALARRAPELEDVKVRGGIALWKPAIFDIEEPAKHIIYNSHHTGGFERKHIDTGACFYEPMRYSELPRYYYDHINPPDVALIQVGPMDKHGYFNFGVSASHMKAICDTAKILIVEVNQNMPRCLGGFGESVHITDVDMIVEGRNDPMGQMLSAPPTEIDKAVAKQVVERIPNGACLQLGIGGMPNAVGMLLCESDLKDMSVHTEMYVEAFVDLSLCGKISGATNVVDGVTWYGVTISGVTGWIRGDLVRILTKTEEAEYIKSGDPDSKPEASYTTLQLGSTGEAVRKVQVRLAELGYMSNSQINSVFDSNTASAISRYQEDHDLVVDGIATSLTQHSLFGTREKSETTNGSSTTVTLHMPKLIDWYTGGIQSIFYKGSTAVVTDVNTGISFRVKRWSGGAHADVEPLTAADTAAMCKIYKVKTAQEISDKNLYQRHPVLVTIGDNSYAASMYGVPHNYPAGDTIPDNDFYGQFCIHFVNSKTHGSGIVDVGNSKNGWYGHQDAIMDAYRNAAKKLNIKN